MIQKAPNDVLDFTWDWSDWLTENSPNDSISRASWTADTGVTILASPAPSNTANTATVWLGSVQLGTYHVTCQITTMGGRVAQFTDELQVVNL